MFVQNVSIEWFLLANFGRHNLNFFYVIRIEYLLDGKKNCRQILESGISRHVFTGDSMDRYRI